MKRRRFLSLFGAGAAGSAQVPSRAATQGAWQPKPGSPEPGTAEETLSRLRPLGGESPSKWPIGPSCSWTGCWSGKAGMSPLPSIRPGSTEQPDPEGGSSMGGVEAGALWQRLLRPGRGALQDVVRRREWSEVPAPLLPQTEYNQSLYAVSRDGIVWEKPLVGTVAAARGEPFQHNCIAPVEIPNVFKDRQDPDPQRRYKMVTFIGDPLRRQGLLLHGLARRSQVEPVQCISDRPVPGLDHRILR